MEQKYLFVGEYEHSYTGGSVVFISTEKLLEEFSSNGLNIILDMYNIELRKVRNFGGSDGIAPEIFWKRVDEENISNEFKDILKSWLSVDPKKERYPGYYDGRIRTDWFPGHDEGIYIVYKIPVEWESDEIEIISDTYYCA